MYTILSVGISAKFMAEEVWGRGNGPKMLLTKKISHRAVLIVAVVLGTVHVFLVT